MSAGTPPALPPIPAGTDTTWVDIPGIEGSIPFPSSMSPDSMAAVAGRLHAAANPGATSPSAAGAPSQFIRTPDLLDRALATMPMVGSALGGLGAGAVATPETAGIGTIPAAMAGSAGGSMAGLAGEQAIQRALGRAQSTQSMGGAALEGAGNELGGRAITGVMGAVAPGLMAKALRVPRLITGGREPEEAAKDLANLALQTGGGVSAGGAANVAAARTASAQNTNRVLKEMSEKGVTIDPYDIAHKVGDLIDEVMDQPISGSDRRSIYSMTKDFMDEHPGPMTPMEAKMLKRRAMSLAEPIIKGRQVRPGVTDAKAAIFGRWNDAIAHGAKQALEDVGLPSSTMPGQTLGQELGASEGRTSQLINLGNTIDRARTATSKTHIGLPFGIKPLGASTPDIALSRGDMSRLAGGLYNPAVQGAAGQTPRLIDLLLGQARLGQQPDSTQGGGQ